MVAKEIRLTGKRGGGKVAMVSDSDYDRVNEHKWHLVPKGYAVAGVYDKATGLQHTTLLHRFVMDCVTGDGQRVDHINRDKLDNRRKNLRIVTLSQSLRNRGKIDHGYPGFVKYKGVRKRKNGFQVLLAIGTFETAEEAARAYDNAVRLIFPGYPVNFPEEGEFGAVDPLYETGEYLS